MLSPKRTKYRKFHRGRMRGKARRGNQISFGDYALQALEPTWITSRQIEEPSRPASPGPVPCPSAANLEKVWTPWISRIPLH